MKRLLIVLLCFSVFSACSQEKTAGTAKEKSMNNTEQTIYLKSRISDQVMPLSLPECMISGVSEIKREQEQEQDKTWAWGVDMRVGRLAFSQPEFPLNLKCENKQDSKGASIYAIYPLNDKEKQLLKSDPFQYLLNEAISVGAVYVGSKNEMALYKTSPVNDSVFISNKFPRATRPLSISFIRYNPKTPNSSFRYYFDIETTLNKEFRLNYTVVATGENSSQFAEKLRNLLENNENVLNYPDIILGFVDKNEKIADFFENQKINK